jgi:hypothetical protein
MVDHVEFASPLLIEKFLNAWRRTGKQRFGLLLGRFKPYEKVPMGIRAVVEAIHEVEQEGEVDGLTLGENVKQEEETVRYLRILHRAFCVFDFSTRCVGLLIPVDFGRE